MARRSRNATAREFSVIVARDPHEARARLRVVMAEARYVRSEAARRLRISATLLRSWITKLGMDTELDAAATAAGFTLARVRGSARPDEPKFVYFIQAGLGGPIKIGWSANVKQRLLAAQVDNHEELTLRATAPGGVEIETRLHALFDPVCIRGEWFRPVRELLELVEMLEDGGTLLPYLEACEDSGPMRFAEVSR